MRSRELHNELIKFAVCAAASFAALFAYEYFMWSREPIPPELNPTSRTTLVRFAIDATLDQWPFAIAGAIAIYALTASRVKFAPGHVAEREER